MVVLSAAILSKNKTLLSRQFVEITRLRIEGLLSAFPKLVDAEKGKDHTYIETESVRYIYQPIEQLFLLLITNKTSNILEDLETLRLLAKTVQESCKHVQVCEEAIFENAFDIIFAFDETISFGYRESVTLSQVKTFLEMESNDEKLHQRIEQSKINEAKEIAKKKALELDKARISAGRDSKTTVNETLNPSDEGALESRGDNGGHQMFSSPVQQPQIQYGNQQTVTSHTDTNVVRAHVPKKGMQLGRKKPEPAAFSLPPDAASPDRGQGGGGQGSNQMGAGDDAAAAQPINPLQEPVTVIVEETCSAASQKFKYRLHPNLNKQSHSAKNVLEMRDADKKFRAGASAALLKWQMKTSEEEEATPLTDDDKKLENIHMKVPCPPGCHIQVKSTDCGSTQVKQDCILWSILSIDSSNASGALEFQANCGDASQLLPVQAKARLAGEGATDKGLSQLEIQRCYHQASGAEIKYELKRSVEYQLVIGA